MVTITLGAKGVVELELVSSGERWGRGPRKDIHSSNKARVDSPAWHLVLALARWFRPTATRRRFAGLRRQGALAFRFPEGDGRRSRQTPQ